MSLQSWRMMDSTDVNSTSRHQPVIPHLQKLIGRCFNCSAALLIVGFLNVVGLIVVVFIWYSMYLPEGFYEFEFFLWGRDADLARG